MRPTDHEDPRSFSLLRTINKDGDASSYANLVDQGIKASYGPQHSLLARNIVPDTVHLVLSGIVTLIHDDLKSKESSQGIRATGWWAGLTFVLLGIPPVYDVITLTDCDVSTVPSVDVLNHLQGNAALLREFLRLQTEELLSIQYLNMLQKSDETRRLQTLWDKSAPG